MASTTITAAAMAASTSSSDEEDRLNRAADLHHHNQPSAPPSYPKIPPPPSEHPPPYTPFGGQTSTLLPQATTSAPTAVTSTAAAQSRTPRVVNPPGIRKYTSHLTARNVGIALIVLIALIVFAYVVHKSNVSDENLASREPLAGTKALDVHWLALGEFNQTLDRITYDENTDSVIVSQYLPEQNLLTADVVQIDDHLSGFRGIEKAIRTWPKMFSWPKLFRVGESDYQLSLHEEWQSTFGVYTETYLTFTRSVTNVYDDCVAFTERVHCCSTSSASVRHHKTECFLVENDTTVPSVATKFDFVPSWQSLADGEQLLILRNSQRHAVLNLRTNRVSKIEENRLPSGYLSVGFFFPMDTAVELEELVRSGEEFRICEYLRTNSADYALKDEECERTPFTVDFYLNNVLFCSNPLYTAVVQYGHSAADPEHLTWHLRVKYDSSPDVYSAAETLEAQHDQLVIDCSDNDLDVFALGRFEVHRYTMHLPNLRSEHFIQPRRL